MGVDAAETRVLKLRERADEGGCGLGWQNKREDDGGRRDEAAVGEDRADVLIDEDEVGDGAVGLGEDGDASMKYRPIVPKHFSPKSL